MSEQRFPVAMNGGTIPWSVAEQAYIAYSKKFGTGQTLERLAERGGFHVSELDLLHPKWREHDQLKDEFDKLVLYVRKLDILFEIMEARAQIDILGEAFQDLSEETRKAIEK